MAHESLVPSNSKAQWQGRGHQRTQQRQKLTRRLARERGARCAAAATRALTLPPLLSRRLSDAQAPQHANARAVLQHATKILRQQEERSYMSASLRRGTMFMDCSSWKSSLHA